VADYAKIEEVQAYGFQLKDEDLGTLQPIISRASRIFDRACELPDDHFAATTANAAARTFYGDGTNYLRLDPYHSTPAPAVTAPTGFTVPTFIEKREPGSNFFALIRTYGDDGFLFDGIINQSIWEGPLFASDLLLGRGAVGWIQGLPFSVTAKWGWASVPDDVIEATIEITLAIFRGKDTAFQRVISLDTNAVVNAALPDRAKMIAEKYMRRRFVFA
jgi:hypothetical protein